MKSSGFYRLLLGLLSTCLTGGVWAQPVVSNIRVEADAQRIKVTYDLAGIADQDSVYLQIESRSRGQLNPKTVTGDVGKHLVPGLSKVIYWDYLLDNQRIMDEIRPTVGVVELKKRVVYTGPPVGGGPANALLSAVLPGLGNIMVQPKHKIGLRPLITVAYGGLLVYGLWQKSRSDRQYALYDAQPFERNAQPYYDEANRLHKHAVLALRTAAVVVLADVIYTFIKGTKNARQIRTFQQHMSLDYIGNTPTVGMQVTF